MGGDGPGLDPRVPAAAAAGFSIGADDDERRPSDPDDAVELLCRELGIGPGARVVDLAAGTGKLTRLLVTTGADVVADLGERFELPHQTVVYWCRRDP